MTHSGKSRDITFYKERAIFPDFPKKIHEHPFSPYKKAIRSYIRRNISVGNAVPSALF